MAVADECPEDVVPPGPLVQIRRRAGPPDYPGAPAPLPPGPTPPVVQVAAIQALSTKLDAVIALWKSVLAVYIKPATWSDIRQYTLQDTSKFTRMTNIPQDALEWELFNSDLGTVTGTLDWAYIADPGTSGNGRFNRMGVNDRAARAIVGVDLYVRPQTAGQVAILEVLRSKGEPAPP